LSGFHFESWFGLLAPAATPLAIQEKINAAVNKIIVNIDGSTFSTSAGPKDATTGFPTAYTSNASDNLTKSP
jgi:tripartite-type tricarboxylate transporter receptor subunit TctC